MASFWPGLAFRVRRAFRGFADDSGAIRRSRRISEKGQIMTAFNAVRFKVKAGREQQFLDAHNKVAFAWSGLRTSISFKPASIPSASSLNGSTWMRLPTHETA